MRSRETSLRYRLGRAVLAAVIFALWIGGVEVPHAQTVRAPPRSLDWSGVWVVPETAFIQALMAEQDTDSPQAPPLTPPHAAALKAFVARRMTGLAPSGGTPVLSNAEQCLPPGMPDTMRYPAGVEFLFTPGRVTMLLEEGPAIRSIPTNGRPRDRNADPSFFGDSVGHWEGATLVVDTTSISARAELIGGVKTSGKAHVVERISLRDPTHLQIDTVVEDPGVLRAPWRYTRVYEKSSVPFRQMICLENNRDHNGGEPDLTPPPQF